MKRCALHRGGARRRARGHAARRSPFWNRANTIVRAFLQAGALALASIPLMLLIWRLRRIVDVALTLVPLLLAGLLTLRNLRRLDLQAQFRQYYRPAAAARPRRRLQDLLRPGVAAGRNDLLADEPDPRRFFSRFDHGERLCEPMAVGPPRDVEHGQARQPFLADDFVAAVLFQPALMGPPRRIEGDADAAL